MERDSLSATRVARWLEAHPTVGRVLHPGLERPTDLAEDLDRELSGADRAGRPTRAWRVAGRLSAASALLLLVLQLLDEALELDDPP